MAAVTLVKPAIADQHVPNNEIIAGCISAPVPILVSKVANWSFQLKIARESRSVLCHIALWKCFGDRF